MMFTDAAILVTTMYLVTHVNCEVKSRETLFREIANYGRGFTWSNDTTGHTTVYAECECTVWCLSTANCVGFTTMPIQDGRYSCEVKDMLAVDGKWLTAAPNATYKYRVPTGFEHYGCYEDDGARVLPTLISNRPRYDFLTTSDKENDLHNMVPVCAMLAQVRGFDLFGLEHEGECWGGHLGVDDYTRLGVATGCSHGAGGEWRINIYRLFSDE